MRALIPALLLAATAASADTDRVLETHILPAVAGFASSAEALEDTARADCTRDALRPAYHATFDAWLGLSHLTFGPLEKDGRRLAIAFWPDSRGAGPRALARLIADQDPAVDSEAEFAEVSIAARGLFALEHLLYGEAYAAESYECRLVVAIAADLDRMAEAIAAEWPAYAALMQTPGASGNATYLAEQEVGQTLYTALMTGLEFTIDQRLGQPLGSFDRPRPRRAEAHRSGRALRNVVLSLEALQDLARAMADGPTPAADRAFDAAFATADKLDDPVLAGVADPTGRLRVEILQQKVRAVKDALTSEIGMALGLSQGFNSADGD
ncbi:MAG: signal peptidase [Rhodobacteraceae bacterium]|nr:MAG: signal peptidase [Paracoccaceae bacterium]